MKERANSEKNREERRRELYQLLGDLPEVEREISASKIEEEKRGPYILEKLLLDLNGIEPVPAYFVYPKEQRGPFPVILYHHAHGGGYVLGKDELIRGCDALQKPSYAEVLTEKGYSALCIDSWCFGERKGRSESETFKEMLWSGQVLWGMMLYDSLRAIDYLASRAEVNIERLGTMGISMGSTMAWWTAALDPRIKVCIDICCLTDYQALIKSRGLDGHGIYYYVPRLLKYFTTVDINKLIVPRPHLSLAGNFDRLTPPEGLDRIDKELREAYLSEGAQDAWKLVRSNTGHFETAAMRREIFLFLEQWL